jgi:aminoglycoside phosphotransferase (APT) family kinase protein
MSRAGDRSRPGFDETDRLADLLDWVSQLTESSAGPLQRISAGSSRATYLVPVEAGDTLILRVDSGGGPVAGTELSLLREAEVYAALAGTQVLIPRLHGVHPDGAAFLMDRAQGTHELSALTDQARVAICDRFMEALATLHLTDPRTLNLPSLRHPASPRDHAMLELDLWQAIMEEKLSGDLTLGRCAFHILRRLAPEYYGPAVLCHGDVGPKNFMFEDGRITALIDWEHAHVGDPMDDLAWWIFRGHEWLGAAGSLPSQLRLWSERTGMKLHAQRLIFYRTLVLVRWYIEIRTGLTNAGASQDRAPYLRLIPALDVKLSHALGQMLGGDLGEMPVLKPQTDLFAEEALRAMRIDLLEQIIPALHEPEARRRANSALEYLAHLEAVERFGSSIRAQDQAELAAFDSSSQDGLAAAATGDVSSQLEFLRYAMRRGARHAYLWPSTLARAQEPAWTVARLGLQ